MKTTGIVLLLIGVSNTFGYLISLYSVAELTGKALEAVTTNPWMMFFLVNLILFVLGTFLDMAATILICTPIFLPICMQYGMGPVQFGMLMLINCALGLNTPPVGTTQFVGCAIGEVSIRHVMKTIWPFYGALIAALFLVTYVPQFSLPAESAAGANALTQKPCERLGADAASGYGLAQPEGIPHACRFACRRQ